ncbi:glutathione S-transferase family protein [Fodinicurvata sediminis]|uniref:glutathione S-transferase family protein n=1 Tax=Fodinicurvata sediminis TaxID=1121832 RepID=UPI0003B794FC|nr:glutathione S-transferase family protein [Fodinicurvata sediminis]
MELFWAPRTRSFYALWALEETGLPHEKVLIDIWSGQQDGADYRAINPMGKVPALRDGEVAVTEAPAICAYLADKVPESGLALPLEDARRGAYYRWLFFAASCIEAAYFEKMSGLEIDARRAGWGSFEKVFTTLARELESREWIAAERFTMADLMIAGGLKYGMMLGILEPRPVFEAYVARCTKRPAYRRAEEIDAAALAEQG